MSFIEDTHAYILAVRYGLTPPRKIGPAQQRIIDEGKFEPDDRAGDPERTIVLAHWLDKTNMLIKYKPADLDYG